VRELLFAGGLLHGPIGTNDQTSVWRDAATKSPPRNNRVKMVVGLARWCNSTRRETHRARC